MVRMPIRLGGFMLCARWRSESSDPRPCASQRLYGGGGKPPGGFLADGHQLPSRTAGTAHGLLDSIGLDQHPRAAALAQTPAAGILTRRANDLCKQRTSGQSKRYSAHRRPRDPGATIMLSPQVLQCAPPTACATPGSCCRLAVSGQWSVVSEQRHWRQSPTSSGGRWNRPQYVTLRRLILR
jgi:hypothetical protein